MKARRPQRTALVITIFSLVIIGTFVYLYYADANPGVHLVIDWRFHVTIYDGGINQNLTIPANIGVANGIWLNHTLDRFGPPGYAPLSTRDTSGTIYVQSIAPRLFVLSDFFSIWGQIYNKTCVGYGSSSPYCSSTNPPFASNGSHEYCLSYAVPPIDNGKEWEILIRSGLPGQATGC